MDRNYQHGFSLQHPEVFDAESRTRKAQAALAVFRDVFAERIGTLQLLNVGASSGAMDAVFADAFANVVGIDIDDNAIGYAQQNHVRPNLRFLVADALDIPFPACSFDAVVCSQIYEHVPDQPKLFAEIHRVLKPGGVCYLAATNRLVLLEPHYRMWFLSWLPRGLADRYLRLRGRGDHYYERMHGWAQLRRLTSAFRTVDYTERMLADPATYAIEHLVRAGTLKQKVSRFIARSMPWLCPGYIWILHKDAVSAQQQ
jgi:ubiquinone/menaquinone biosynthesis C-methylase UbiE